MSLVDRTPLPRVSTALAAALAADEEPAPADEPPPPPPPPPRAAAADLLALTDKLQAEDAGGVLQAAPAFW